MSQAVGWSVEVVQTSSTSKTQDERATRRFCVCACVCAVAPCRFALFVLDRWPVTALQGRRWRKRRQKDRPSQRMRSAKWNGHRSPIEGKSSKKRRKIEPKSLKNRSWSLRGATGRFADAPGRHQDAAGVAKSAPGAPQERSWGAPGPPRALLGRAGARRERSETLRERSRDALAACWCRRTLTEAPADRFLTFSACRAEAPMCVLYHSCQCFVRVGASAPFERQSM